MPEVLNAVAATVPPAAERAPSHGRLSLGGRIGTLIGVTIPLAGFALAVGLLWGRGVDALDLVMLGVMYAASVIGVTVGFHRLFTHRSFETFRPIQFILTALGSMALQGNMIHWVGLHRWHHQHSDTPEDVHSPLHQGTGLWGFLRGFWHAHIGWAFRADPPRLERYVRDLKSSRTLRIASGLFPLWVLLGLAIPAALGGLITGTWSGAGTAFLWGGMVRIFLVHHVTWCINSVCHIWGRRPFRSDDDSRDNFVMGVLAFGEGWHNTHHAFPTSARHGLRWWQPDVSYSLIRTLAFFGLVWNVKLPSPEAQRRERNVNPF